MPPPTAPASAGERLICALDVDSRDRALRLVDETADVVSFYKVGLQLFVAAGMPLVDELGRGGKRVFLDLKMDDIEETIRLAVGEVARHPADLLTLQGGPATLRAAVAGRGAGARPRLLSVTLLSSLGEGDLREAGLVGPGARFADLEAYVDWRAAAALDAGADGLIASGTTVARVRRAQAGRSFLVVTPGVRPAGDGVQEHKRATSPGDAVRAGADYLVVGRPIRDAASPRDAARRIVDEIDRALAARV